MAREELETKEELDIDEMHFEETQQEESTTTHKGQVRFKSVNHSERAIKKFGRMSDGETAKYLNVALEYFDNRCALSGEKFVKFDKKTEGKSTNLSAEHVVALCIGGHDIVPNLTPSVLQYNIRKNGYYLLDYWDKQKDSNGKSIYSPYRLLKLVNYMMKSVKARGLDIEEYSKIILESNAIDKYLDEIKAQDLEETDNSKRKLLSDTITSTTIDEDNKKILTVVPTIEGSMPTQKAQAKELESKHYDERTMIDIFLTDAVKELAKVEEISRQEITLENGTKSTIQQELEQMLKETIGEIPFEVNVRDRILKVLDENIIGNRYSVANDLLQNTDILKQAKTNELEVERQIQERINSVNFESLTQEQKEKIIAINPQILYNEQEKEETSKLLQLYIQNHNGNTDEINIELFSKSYFVNMLKVQKWMIENDTMDAPKSKQNKDKSLSCEEMKLGRALNNIKSRLKKYVSLDIEERQSYIQKYPGTAEILTIVEELGISLEERKAIQEFIEKLELLNGIGVDISKLVQSDTIESLCAKQGIDIDKLEEHGIDKRERIGNAKNSIAQAYRGKGQCKPPSKEEVEKLKELGISLEKQERNVTQEFIEKLELLNWIGVDVSKIELRDTIESLCAKQGIDIDKLEELGLGKRERIGNTKSRITQAYRGKVQCKPPSKGEVEKLKELGISLEERKPIQEFIEKLELLNWIGVDVSKIATSDTIESLCAKQGIDIDKLEEFGIDKREKIGNTKRSIALAYRGKGSSNPPSKEEVEKLKELGISLEKQERNVTQEFIEKVELLTEIGIDISKIERRDTIESLCAKQGIDIDRLEELGIDKRERIGNTKNSITQAYRGNGKCKPPSIGEVEKLKELGISLEERNVTQEFIDKLNLLTEIGIDVSKIATSDTIESLCAKQGIDIYILEEFGIDKREKIGNTKSHITQAYRGKGQCKPPSKGEVEKLKKLGISLEKQERNVIQEFIEKLELLNGIGIDISKIVQRDTIESLCAKQGIDIYKLEELGIDKTEKIGSAKDRITQAYRGKGSSNPPSKEEVAKLKQLGISLEKKRGVIISIEKEKQERIKTLEDARHLEIKIDAEIAKVKERKNDEIVI